jgi:biopolymer transport protein ExbD
MKVKRRNVKRGRIEIIPLIDTIVILLIFYMTFSRFSQMQSESALKLPQSRAGDEFKKLPQQIVVNMHSAEHVSIGGTKYKVSELPGIIRNYYANLSRTDSSLAQKLKNGDVKPSIILRGSRDMAYKDLSDFMRVCAKTDLRDFLPQGSPPGVTEVTFTAEEIRGK